MDTTTDEPRIALLMGDAAGIGPELVIRALRDPALAGAATWLVLGSLSVMRRTAECMSESITFISASEPVPDAAVPVLEVDPAPAAEHAYGVIDAANGAHAAAQMKTAVDLASRGEIDGVVIAPLHKEAIHRAGYDFPDEMAYLGELTGTYVRNVVTWNGIFRSTVTGHVPLRDVADLVTRDRIAPVIDNLWATMGRLGIEPRRIGVAGLNPHAGEGGAFGDEEIREIAPAVEAARERGIDATGPWPADTVFVRAMKGEFNGVLFLYHDQGNTAMKVAAFGEGVLLYTGLPFPCAGPAHGVAYDIAGRGVADATSFRQAVDFTIRLARRTASSIAGTSA